MPALLCRLRAEEKAGELSTDEWLKLIDYLAENGVIQTYIEGGEPLHRPDFLKTSTTPAAG